MARSVPRSQLIKCLAATGPSSSPMFATGSPYSPFFISGLLSSRPVPVTCSLCHTDPSPSLRLRRSRDSLRSIPSPGPAPSTTLPEIPLGLSLQQASLSAPALLVSVKRNSITSVSPSVRHFNRSHALARLEGRSTSIRRKPRPVKRNFMSMSDEESEADDDDDRVQNDARLSVINEPEDLVLPPAMPLSSDPIRPRRFLSSVRIRSTSPRKRQTMTKDWFPLKSFIDLQAADDDTINFRWRSFIEVSRVS